MEIIKWSMENEVDISSGIINKFIILLLSHGKEHDISDMVNRQTIANINNYKF